MNWWTKLKTMSEYDLKLLPYGFLKKYGSMLNFLRRMEKEAHVKENKQHMGYYDQIKNAEKLTLNSEKEAHRAYVELHQTPEDIKITDLVREEGDYFRRQPRVDPAKLNFNYEQYKRFSKDFSVAKAKDDFESQRFYKMIAYIKAHKDNKRDPWVDQFMVKEGHNPDMIEIPEEFKDLTPEAGDELKGFGRQTRKRKLISKKRDKSQFQYDAWRCSDRTMLKGSGKNHAVATLQIAPADLVKLFGMPDPTEIFYHGSAQYTFEDNNLDMYCLYDYKQTDYYHGINRNDDYYTTEKNLKLPLH